MNPPKSTSKGSQKLKDTPKPSDIYSRLDSEYGEETIKLVTEANTSATSEFAKYFDYPEKLRLLAMYILKIQEVIGDNTWDGLVNLLKNIKEGAAGEEEKKPLTDLLYIEYIEYMVTDQILNHNYNHRKIKNWAAAASSEVAADAAATATASAAAAEAAAAVAVAGAGADAAAAAASADADVAAADADAHAAAAAAAAATAREQETHIEYFIDNIYPRSCPKQLLSVISNRFKRAGSKSATHSESRDWESETTQLHKGYPKSTRRAGTVPGLPSEDDLRALTYDALHHGRKQRVIVPEGSIRGSHFEATPFGETENITVTVPSDWISYPGTGIHTLQLEGTIESKFIEDDRIDEQTWKDWWIFGYEHGLDRILREEKILTMDDMYILSHEAEIRIKDIIQEKMNRLYSNLKAARRGQYIDSFTQKSINILKQIGNAARGTHAREIVAGVAGVALTGGVGIAIWLAAVSANHIANKLWDNYNARHAPRIHDISTHAHQSGYIYAYDLYTQKHPNHIERMKERYRPLTDDDIKGVTDDLSRATKAAMNQIDTCAETITDAMDKLTDDAHHKDLTIQQLTRELEDCRLTRSAPSRPPSTPAQGALGPFEILRGQQGGSARISTRL